MSEKPNSSYNFPIIFLYLRVKFEFSTKRSDEQQGRNVIIFGYRRRLRRVTAGPDEVRNMLRKYWPLQPAGLKGGDWGL